MPVKIRVRNYQSLRDVTLHVNGFVAVTGRNNAGKTAFLRAIKGLLTNAKGSLFVRHGTESCRTDIDFGDGHEVSWEKGPKVKPKYTIDGKEIHPGASLPEELAPLGVKAITAGDRELWPQIAGQNSGQVFLLDQPGSLLAEVVADVDRVGQLNAALRAAESDRRSASAELKVRRADVSRAEDEHRKFDGLDDATSGISDLIANQAALQADLRKLAQLKLLRQRIGAARVVLKNLSGIDQVHVPNDEPVQDAKASLSKVSRLSTIRDRLSVARGLVIGLAGVDEIVVPEASKVEAVKVLLSKVGTIRKLGVSLEKARKVAKRLDGVDRIRVPEGIPEGDITKLANIRRLRDRMGAARDLCASLETDIQVSDTDFQKASEGISELLQALGTCPTCGSNAHQTHR